FMIAELGAWKTGATVVPLNPMYTEHELQDALSQTGAEIIVALTPFVARLKACQSRTRVRLVIATNIKEYLPPFKQVLFTLFRERSGGHRIRLGPGDLRFRDLLRAQANARRPKVDVRPEDPAIILMSGGTTGTPKGVVAPHRSLVIAGLQIREWVKSLCSDWQDTLLLPLPLFHVYANVGVQSLALVGHNTLALIPNPREIDDVLDTIAEVQPSFFTGVPTLFIALCNHERVKSGTVSFKSIKVCFSGAAPLLADTKTRFEELTGGRLVEGYSLTEAMMACLVNPLQGVNKIGSVGLPLPAVHGRIVAGATAPDVLLAQRRGDRHRPPRPWRRRPVAAHRRPRARRRRRIHFHRRSPERPDQDQRLPGVAARGRRGPGLASRRRGSRGRRSVRRGERAGGVGVDRPACRPDCDRAGSADALPQCPGPVQSAGPHRVSQRAAQDDGGQGPAPSADGGRRSSGAHATVGIGSFAVDRSPRAAVSLRVLGCGDAFGSGGRSHTSFFLE